MENKKKHTLGFQRIIRRLLDGGGGRKFAIRPRDESGQLLSRCSSKFRKRKEGREKESLSLSSKIELYVIVLTIVTTSSSQERIIRWSIFRRNDVHSLRL